MKLIVFAGTPGTGKTAIGSWLARRLGCRYTTLSWIVLENMAWTSYDSSRRSFVIDEDALKNILKGFRVSRGCLVIETHWLEPLNVVGDVVERVIVTRCHPLKLYHRLCRRGWPHRKIAENVEAELVGVIASEAIEYFQDRVAEIDTSHVSVGEAREEALAIVSGRIRGSCCIDWLEKLKPEEVEELVELTNTGGCYG